MSSLHFKKDKNRENLGKITFINYKDAVVFFNLLWTFSLSTLHWRPMHRRFSMRSSR
jgi:hypothetical protein